MKVLHVYRTCYPETNGGTEQVIRSISQGCREKGIISKILTLSEKSKPPYTLNGIEIIPVKKRIEIASNGFSAKLIRKFEELSAWADIIHFHYPWPTGDLLALMTNKPMVVTYHSDIIRQKILRLIYKPLEHCFLKKANRIIATSPQYAESSKNLKKFQHKVEVVPLAINENNYKKPSEERVRNWEQRVGRGFFLFVGVLRYYKGLNILLDAAAKTNQTIIIAGDGPLKEALIRQAQQLNLANVTFLGAVSEEDKMVLLTLSKAFVSSSHLRSEAFGVALLEAQLFSKPLITCEVGTGSSYVNQHEETGLIVSPENPRQLANAIQTIAENAELAQLYGKNGHARFKKLFTNETQCEKYSTIYKKVIKENEHRH